MSLRSISLILVVVACLFMSVIPVQAESGDNQPVKVIYQTAFSSDPRWVTNSPSSDYWDPATGRYHFSIEPSTGNYAYTEIPSMEGSFTFEYDVTLDRVDDGAAFRFGVTGAEMDFNKGPNVISMFSNGKHRNIMSLHLVTVGSKQMEVNSQNDDTLTSGSYAYRGPTVRFELNKTYHVIVDYDDATTTTSMRVTDKASGKEIWNYFITTVEKIRRMNRIYLGSRGDYGNMNIYARGYIDNVRLAQPGIPVTEEPVFVTPDTTVLTPVTTKAPLPVPTPLPVETATPESSTGSLLPLLAFGILGIALVLCGTRKP